MQPVKWELKYIGGTKKNRIDMSKLSKRTNHIGRDKWRAENENMQ